MTVTEHFIISYEMKGKEMFYLTTHSTHFIYGYMASDIWLRTNLIVRKETRCRHIGFSFRLTARVLLYAPSHRQDNTYHSLCYTSCGALTGTRNSSMWSYEIIAVIYSVSFIGQFANSIKYLPMPVPAGAISLEKNSKAFLCRWWAASHNTTSLTSWNVSRVIYKCS